MGECEVVTVRGKVGAELMIPYFSLEKVKGVYLLFLLESDQIAGSRLNLHPHFHVSTKHYLNYGCECSS